MPPYAKILGKDVVGADGQEADGLGPDRKAGIVLHPTVKLLPRGPQRSALAVGCEALAHLRKPWLPFLDQPLLESAYLAIEQQALPHPAGALGGSAVEIALRVLQAKAAHPDGSKLPDEPHFVEGTQFFRRGLDMFHVERQGIALQGVTDVVQLLLDLKNGNRAGCFGLKGCTDARPPPPFKLLPRQRRLAARRDHAQPPFDGCA